MTWKNIHYISIKFRGNFEDTLENIYFQAPDEDALYLVKSLESVMERDGAVLNEPLHLETHTSRNFMGFFVAEEHADYLKRIAMQYAKEVSNASKILNFQ